jgi:hypothetical protein
MVKEVVGDEFQVVMLVLIYDELGIFRNGLLV